MMSGMLTVGGVDVYTRARFVVSKIRGVLDWPGRDLDTVSPLGYDGERVANAFRGTKGRPIEVEGTIDGRDTTQAAFLARLDALADLLENQAAPLTLGFPSIRTGVAYTGDLVGPRVSDQPIGASAASRLAQFKLQFYCPRPFGKDTAATGDLTSFDTSHAAIAMAIGTADNDIIVKIRGAATSPITLTHKDYNDVTIGTMVINVALADTSQYVRIVTAERMVYKDVGAGEVEAMDDLSVGYQFPVLRAKYQNRFAADYQTLTNDKGGLSRVYYKEWR